MAGLAHEDFVVEVPATAFHELAMAARGSETALAQRIADLEKSLDSERERLADEALLAYDENTKVLDRDRSRLAREMATQIGIVKALREIAAPEEIEVGSGSSVPYARPDPVFLDEQLVLEFLAWSLNERHNTREWVGSRSARSRSGRGS